MLRSPAPGHLVAASSAIIGLVGGVALLFETRLIYFPSRGHVVTPADLDLAHEDVWLTADDGARLHAWYLPVPQAPWVTIFSHGNAGNISDRLDRALLLQARLRSSVLLYDYRGYGASEGSPDEAGTYRDADAAYRFLSEDKNISSERIVLFGESLGSAVSLELALARPAAALVLEAPFTSVPDMVRTTVLAPLAPLVRTRYDNLAKIRRLRVPLLVLQGDRDEVVPFAQGRRLFDEAPEPKRHFAVTGAGHNDTYIVGGEGYWRAISDFLESVRASSRSHGKLGPPSPGRW